MASFRERLLTSSGKINLDLMNELKLYISSVDFDQRYSAYPTPTYPSDSVSVAENSIDMNGKTKSARNFIYTLIR